MIPSCSAPALPAGALLNGILGDMAMKMVAWVLSAVFSAAIVVTASADQVPKRTSNYGENYKTLVEDQKAPAQIAECIATSYDYADAGKQYDRLGFTQDDIKAAKTTSESAAFSAKDARVVSTLIAVTGSARQKAGNGDWKDIILRCGYNDGKLQAIELVPAQAAAR